MTADTPQEGRCSHELEDCHFNYNGKWSPWQMKLTLRFKAHKPQTDFVLFEFHLCRELHTESALYEVQS